MMEMLKLLIIRQTGESVKEEGDGVQKAGQVDWSCYLKGAFVAERKERKKKELGKREEEYVVQVDVSQICVQGGKKGRGGGVCS